MTNLKGVLSAGLQSLLLTIVMVAVLIHYGWAADRYLWQAAVVLLAVETGYVVWRIYMPNAQLRKQQLRYRMLLDTKRTMEDHLRSLESQAGARPLLAVSLYRQRLDHLIGKIQQVRSDHLRYAMSDRDSAFFLRRLHFSERVVFPLLKPVYVGAILYACSYWESLPMVVTYAVCSSLLNEWRYRELEQVSRSSSIDGLEQA